MSGGTVDLVQLKAQFFDAQREIEALELRKRPYQERMRKLIEQINRIEEDERQKEATADAAAKSKRKRN